ncbi:hypothetical protein Trydic_g21251 [Trypoxylus dichotomus]
MTVNTDLIPIGHGIGQGDAMAPKLFFTVLESAFKPLKWGQKGVNIEWEVVNGRNVRLTGDREWINGVKEDRLHTGQTTSKE